MKLIDKAALVAEINKRIIDAPIDCYGHQRVWAYNDVKDIINTLEVKEVQEELQVKEFVKIQRINETCKENSNSLTQEPVSEDLKEFEVEYIEREKDNIVSVYDRHAGLVDGAQWQKEQFEKNRIAACRKQTEEEAEIECDFFMGIIEKEHRQPTFDDAIKYGMRLQKEQMVTNSTDAMIGLPYENKDGGYTHLVDVSRPLPVGDNKIAIIFKEE